MFYVDLELWMSMGVVADCCGYIYGSFVTRGSWRLLFFADAISSVFTV